ncbi:MAG: hypothetical protein WAK26_19620 [Terracidiphilus sp.]
MATQNEQTDGPALRTSVEFFHPHTDLEREEVRKELRKILESSVFHNSKRYATVLKFIVDQTLAGCGDQLKERTIGIEVFRRTPDYDTAVDHAVRSAVAEVRKRLAQYYQQNVRGQYRIEVLPGSYMPQFRRATERPIQLPSDPDSVPERPDWPGGPITLKRSGRSHWLGPKRLTVACAILVTSVAVLVAYFRPRDTFEIFWKPILSSRSPVLLCIGNVQGGLGPQGEKLIPSPTLTLSDFQNSAIETVSAHDSITAAKFAGLMEANGQRYEFKSQSDTTFTDLQRGPFILVGLLNNSWTERLVPKLRFSVEQTANKVRIRDSKNPSSQDWSVDYSTPYLDITRDYALVLRVLDPKSEQIVVVDAGITVFGTFAAGDFLTNKKEMNKLAAIAPSGWEKKNMEIVLSTDVIRGRSGPATIVAAQFW